VNDNRTTSHSLYFAAQMLAISGHCTSPRHVTLGSMSVEPRFRRSAAWALCLLCTGSAFLAAYAVSDRLTISVYAAHVVGFSCVVAATLAASHLAPSHPRAVVVIVLTGLALIAGAYLQRQPIWLCALVVALALLAAGSSLGAAIGARIEHPGHLLFVALASALADIFSVASPSGPSAAIAQSQLALSLAAVAWPMLGTRNIEPFLGVGDIVFSGLYLASARKHGFTLRRTLLALASGYALTMFGVFVLRTAVPALPFLGAAMLFAHPEARRPPAADRRRGLVVLSVMAALFVALLLRPGH
jgi:hypothetical protein